MASRQRRNVCAVRRPSIVMVTKTTLSPPSRSAGVVPRRRSAVDRDGYENNTFSTRLGFAPSQNTELNLIARRISTHQDLDIGSGEDPDARSVSHQSAVRTEAKGYFFD